MRVTEAQLRRIVRSSLRENLQGFLDDTSEVIYSTDREPGEPETSLTRGAREKSKNVKRIWSKNADHGFFKGLTKVHWLQEPSRQFGWFLGASGKDEISTSGYLPGARLKSLWGSIGVVVDGRVTLASNDMDTMLTGYSEETRPEARSAHTGSGVPKRSRVFTGATARDYILDSDSFDPSASGQNELIVDNWSVTGVVLPIRQGRDGYPEVVDPLGNAEDTRFVMDLALAAGIPLLDPMGKQLDPAAVRAARGIRSAGGQETAGDQSQIAGRHR